MHNMVYLIGRLVDEPREEENKAIINLAVNRCFKNEDGIYETDFLNVYCYNFISGNIIEYCHKGDLIGVKGRIESYSKEINGEKYNLTRIIADKVSFLRCKSHEEDE